jgi:hypothetical protein
MEDMRVLEETKGINLPNFLPRSAFHVMLKNKMETIDQGAARSCQGCMGVRRGPGAEDNASALRKLCSGAVIVPLGTACQGVVEMELGGDYTANPD